MRRDEKRKAEERAVGAFPGHVGLMKIHGFSIGAIKSTTSLPLPCSSLRRLFSRDSFSRRSERTARLHRTLNLGFILTRVYDDRESLRRDRVITHRYRVITQRFPVTGMCIISKLFCWLSYFIAEEKLLISVCIYLQLISTPFNLFDDIKRILN